MGFSYPWADHLCARGSREEPAGFSAQTPPMCMEFVEQNRTEHYVAVLASLAVGTQMVGHRTGRQLRFGEEIGLVLPNMSRTKAIGRAVEMSCEPFNVANVVACGTGNVRNMLNFSGRVGKLSRANREAASPPVAKLLNSVRGSRFPNYVPT